MSLVELPEKYLEIEHLNDIDDKPRSSFIISMINMMKSIICTGILMLPYTFYHGGYVETTVTLAIVGLSVGYTCICFHEVITD